MMKRTLSLLLCLIMVLGLAAPFVQAATTPDSDDIYIAEDSSVSVLVDSLEKETKPMEGGGQDQGEAPMVQTSPAVISESSEVTCDCGTQSEELAHHSDACALKRYCISLCTMNSMDIYSKWYAIGVSERHFIKEYLGQHYSETLSDLQILWNADKIKDENDSVDESLKVTEETTSSVTAQVGDIQVDAVGVPEGSSLTVTDVTDNAAKAVEKAVDELGRNPNQLFLYDISVQNDESDDWQPSVSKPVYMELTVPGVKLHKYATVYVIHVDDNGETNTIEAEVTGDGVIGFETYGFSTFAGFIVDFMYGEAYFSIKGESKITLSALFDNLKMPLYASDAVNVTFTDYSLISVEQIEGDWLLTSLKAFNTEEYLTITMKDGYEYVINVTDDNPPYIYVGGGAYGNGTRYDKDSAHNHYVSWYADGDGDLGSQTGNPAAYNDGWSRDSTIYIGGSEGDFEIGIYHWSNIVNSDRDTCFITMKQIRVSGGAHLKVTVEDAFDNVTATKVYLVCHSTANMFIIEGGSLTLQGRPATSTKNACYLILDGTNDEIQQIYGSSSYPTTGLTNELDNQLVALINGANSFTANYVRFQDAPMSAIRISTSASSDNPVGNGLDSFTMTNCIFDDDVCREDLSNEGSGGAIYLQAMNGNNYTWIDNFSLTDCQFNGCYAAQSGGAIALNGRVKNVTIDGCTFTGTKAGTKKSGNGGAISLAGHFDTVTIKDSYFYDCTADGFGGAISTRSTQLNSSFGTYSRLNELNIENCHFSRTKTTETSANYGGGICIESQTENVTIKDSTFTDLLAAQGGAISFNYTNLSDANPTQPADFIRNSYFDKSCNDKQYLRTTVDTDKGTSTDYYRSTIGAVTMSNCDFTRIEATNQGGGIHAVTHSTIRSLSMDDVNFDGCKAVKAGSAIMLSDTVVGTLSYTNSTVQNCKTTHDSSSEVGGTLRTIGSTTCAATINNVDFLNNASHCSGGGIYWNASGVRTTAENTAVSTAVSINDCVFDGNTAGWYGGGIYCEAVMTVTKCELKNNISLLRGGGIALQVYNSNVRTFADDQSTNLTLDNQTNVHHNQSKVGGGISIRANATAAITESSSYKHSINFQLNGANIFDNYATENGGGIWFNVESYDTSTDSGEADQQEVERFNKSIDLDKGSVYNNRAAGNGGGIYMNGGIITDYGETDLPVYEQNGSVTILVSGATIYGNEAGRSMTGVTITKSDLPPSFTVSKGSDLNIAFTKGTATGGNGGGIYLEGQTAVCTVNGGVIGATGKQKTQNGTTVLVPDVANGNIATAKAGTTDGNSGGNGGGIGIYGGARIEMTGGYLVNNSSDISGGGISVHRTSTMKLENGNVENNTSNMGGGISLNGATGDGGEDVNTKYGMYVNGGVIKDNKVYPNSTDTTKEASRAFGGGICIANQSTMLINDGEISGNKAVSEDGTTYKLNQEGGGVAICQGSTLTITGGKITENKAYDGGGMVIRSNGTEGNTSTVNMTGSTTVVDGEVTDYTGGK